MQSNKPKIIRIIPIYLDFEIIKNEVTPIIESKIQKKVNI